MIPTPPSGAAGHENAHPAGGYADGTYPGGTYPADTYANDGYAEGAYPDGAPPADTYTNAHWQQTVLSALGGLGTPVDHSGRGSVPLEGPHVLWLVVSGATDLFAVDAREEGNWHFLGRLGPGTLTLGPLQGPRHTLITRPLRGCELRRIGLRELLTPAYDTQGGFPPGNLATEAYGNGYDSGQYDLSGLDTGGATGTAGAPLSPLETAFALGVGQSLRVLVEAPMEAMNGGDGSGVAGGFGHPGDPGYPGTADGHEALSMELMPGSVRYGAEFAPDAAGELLIDGTTWQRLVNQQYRLLDALDRWIEHRERAHEDRTAAGLEAGEAVRDEANRALVESVRSSRGPTGGGSAAGTDATLAVCRRVARAAGITLSASEGSLGGDERTDPVERVALSSRIRTRPVSLSGEWWRRDSGPLVGHRRSSGSPVALLWRRGRYEAYDPDGRRTRLNAASASRIAERAVMFYRPLPDRPLSAWRLARFCLQGTRRDLRDLALGGLVAVALGALVPLATGRVLGVYVPNAETDLIVQVSLALVVSALVSAVFMLLQNLSILRMEGRIEATLQPAVWDRLLRLPTRFFAERSTGELASSAMGISAMRRVLSGVGPVAVQSGTVGTMNLALLLYCSVPLALAAIALLAVVACSFLVMGLWQVRWQRRLVRLNNQLNNQAFQTLRGLPKLRVAAAESFAYAAWAREFARSRELQQRVGRVKNLTTVLNAVYLPFCSLGVFMLLAGPARGSLSASEFLTFNTAVTMMLTSATQLTGALVSVAAVLPMYEQVRPVLRALPEVSGRSTLPATLTGRVEARGLTFRYSPDGPLVIDDVSLRVEPGEFVAVVGESGCGKSTLLRLLIGFDAPVSGNVLYDGQDLSALDQAAVRRQCGVVLQNAQPFTGSIMDCIRGTESYTAEEVWAAAAMAGLAEDIKRMPMGMQTMLSDGSAVSGGQRQRLMIAQALIRRPRVLFFDEATSALDNEAQRVVIRSTQELRASRVVIAHRLSTIMDADRVLVMSEGRIVQQGTPAELLADPAGRFRELVRRQLR